MLVEEIHYFKTYKGKINDGTVLYTITESRRTEESNKDEKCQSQVLNILAWD